MYKLWNDEDKILNITFVLLLMRFCEMNSFLSSAQSNLKVNVKINFGIWGQLDKWASILCQQIVNKYLIDCLIW
jgi:hypothetical protein